MGIVEHNSPRLLERILRWLIQYHTNSLHKVFLTRGNSTCQNHIHQHHEYYSEHCKEEGIEEKEHCIPPEILKAHKSKSKALVQSKLHIMGVESAPKKFSRERTLCTVAQFVTCDDQVWFWMKHDETRLLTVFRPSKFLISPGFVIASHLWGHRQSKWTYQVPIMSRCACTMSLQCTWKSWKRQLM